MNVLAFGGGTNSLAMLVGLHERGESLDLILFADTGGEKPHTYTAVEQANEYCKRIGFPEIITVKYTDKNGDFLSLEAACLSYRALPSIAYGFKSCSQKHKVAPVDKYLNNHSGCMGVWARGEKVNKLIGIDAGEPHRQIKYESSKFESRYPLVEWDWARDECREAITRAGLNQPGKSACFFCPSSKKAEIVELKIRYPDLAARALAMEANAQLTNIKGLGRNFSWTAFLNANEAQQKLFPNPIITECGSCYDGIHISEAP